MRTFSAVPDISVAATIWMLGILNSAGSAQDVVSSPDSLEEIRVETSRIQPAKPEALDTVTQVSMGSFGAMALEEAPFSVSVASEELMLSTQAGSVADAVRYLPVVQSQTGGSLTTDYFSLRGFTSSVWTYNMSLDGMRSYNPYEALDDKEQIEVLTGANSFAYGVTSPGGMINYVQKQPLRVYQSSVATGLQGKSEGSLRADVAGPIGKSLAFRVNAASYHGETSTEDQVNTQYVGSGSLSWYLLPSLTWSLDASMFHRDVEHTQALFMIGKATEAPEAPDPTKNYGGSFGFTKDNYKRIGTGIQYAWDSLLIFRTYFRLTQFDREYTITRRSFVNVDGDYTTRIDYQGKNQNYVPQGNAFLDANFNTWKVRHRLSLGYSRDLLITKLPYPNGSFVYTSSDVNSAGSEYPAEPDTIPASGYPRRTTERLMTQTFVVSDQIRFNRFFSTMLGLSRSYIQDSTWAAATGKLSQGYDQDAFSPSAALLFSPLTRSTLYVSYNRGLQKGSIAPTTAANAGDALAPFVAEQWETGVKYLLGKCNLGAAFYRISQANAYTDSGTNVYSADGREVHTGMELTLGGRVIPSLLLSGGVTLQTAHLEKTSTATLKDRTPQGVANTSAKLFADYSLPWVQGLSASAGFSYIGKEWVDAMNTISIPSVVTADLGLGYRTPWDTRWVMFRANVSNVANQAYWTTRSGILYPGNARTFALSVELTGV